MNYRSIVRSACCALVLLPIAAVAQDFDPMNRYSRGTWVGITLNSVGGPNWFNYNEGYPRYMEWDGQNPVYRTETKTKDWLCALTRITGAFEGGNQIVLQPRDGIWVLGLNTYLGKYQSASVRCVPYRSFVGYNPASLQMTSLVQSSDGWSQLWPESCISTLNGIYGPFNGGGEWAAIYPKATGTSPGWPSTAFGVERHAQGFAHEALHAAYGLSVYLGGDPGKRYWAGRTRWVQGEGHKMLTRTADTFCFLAGVGGKFRGAGEVVEVVAGADGFWWLQGASQQEAVWADAECVWYGQQW
jgi:hypothetical protein